MTSKTDTTVISGKFKEWFEREWASYQDKAISDGKIPSMTWALKAWRASRAAAIDEPLPLMRKAFRVTEIEGDPDPNKQRFHMRFTFRSMEELHAADDQWRAFATQPVEQTYRTHTTQPGESVMGIALRQCGDEKEWRHILACNPKFADLLPHEYFPVGTLLTLLPVAQPVEQTRALTEKDMDKLGSILFTRFYTDTEFDRWSEANQKTKVVFINAAKAILAAARPASGETE